MISMPHSDFYSPGKMPLQDNETPWWSQNKDNMNMQSANVQPLEQSVSMLNRSQLMPHTMPLPSETPWNMHSMSWGMPSPKPLLVTFTGNPLHDPRTHDNSMLHCKRKSDLQVKIPHKQFITDEKMAAHLSGLHISSDYTTHQPESSPEASTSQGYSRLLFSNEDLVERLRFAQKVILSDEMKNISKESLLPSTLLQRMNEQRCMSLVLWKPPEKFLSAIKEDDEDNNNNADTNTSSSSLHHRQSVLNVDNVMDIEM